MRPHSMRRNALLCEISMAGHWTPARIPSRALMLSKCKAAQRSLVDPDVVVR